VNGVLIPADVADAIRAHAQAAYPNECCGALIGSGSSVLEAFALDNKTTSGARRRFLVESADYRYAEARARAAGGELLGFYHSHPDHPARPSQFDLDHAWPNLSYVIVAVDGGRPAAMTSWRLRDDRSAFDEETIHENQGTHPDAAPALHRQA
jgi:proteasome lid subunit RPN8/RPN11